MGYLYHQLEHGITLKYVAMALRVAVLVHQVDQRLLYRVVRLLQAQSQRTQSFIGLDDLIAGHATGCALVLHILHNATHTLREFSHKVCCCCEW